MPFLYCGTQQGALRQGEIIGPIWIHTVPTTPAAQLNEGDAADVSSSRHELVIVMHADCDLEQDFNERLPKTFDPKPDAKPARMLPGVLLCELLLDAEIRGALPGSDVYKRVSKNADERYHCFQPAHIDGGGELPQLFMDFKRSHMIAPVPVYLAMHSGSIQRKAMVPPVYLQDVMHRYFGFHSRVGAPD